MKRIILIAGFLVFLSFSGKAQQKIIHTFDKHDRLKSSELPDSLIFKQTYDNVGNPILDFIINPCYDRPDPVILYTSPLIFCQGDSVILTAPPSLKYLWSTSDTTRSIIVKNAGFYFLTTFNTLNCTKTSSPVEVKVNSLPNPQILASGPTTFCQGSNVTLTSSLTGVYLWSNGKASKSIVADSAQNYILTVTDSNGCKNSVSQTVSFYSQPSVGFNINKEKQCKANHAFDFENTSSISSGSLTYKWDFGDGNTSTLTNVTDKNYTASSGNYLVKLICTSNNGCKDSLTKSVTVYPNPVSAFTISKPTQCFNGHNFGLVNNTTLSSGSITYLWSFGDSKTDTLANPSKKYISYGTYSIQLVSISNNGCRDSITKTVIVFASPKADFTVNNDKQCKNGHIFNFINNSSIDSDSMTYLWDHGDGTDTTSMNSNGRCFICRSRRNDIRGCG